jgi:hypothetical protein
MSDLINHLSRFAGFILAGLGGPAFWTISSSGHVIGSLTFEAGTWRLAWFENADPRLRDYRGAVTEDVEALAETLSARAGIPVSFDPVIL